MRSSAGLRGPMPDSSSQSPARRACGYEPTALGASPAWMASAMGALPARGQRVAVAGHDVFGALDTRVQRADVTVVQRIDPGVHGDGLAALPGVLQYRALADVQGLLDHVQFAQRVVAPGRRHRVKAFLVFVEHVADVPWPVVDQS